MNFSIYFIGKQTFLYEDATSKLTISDITNSDFENKFEECKLDVPNFALTHSTIWSRITIKNNTNTTTWFLQIENPVLDTVIFLSLTLWTVKSKLHYTFKNVIHWYSI